MLPDPGSIYPKLGVQITAVIARSGNIEECFTDVRIKEIAIQLQEFP